MQPARKVAIYRQKNELNYSFEADSISKKKYASIYSLIEFEYNKHSLYSDISRCTKKVYKLWSTLMNVNVTMESLQKLCISIAQEAINVDRLYKNCCRFGVIKYISEKYLKFVNSIGKDHKNSAFIKEQISKSPIDISYEWNKFSCLSNGGMLIMSSEVNLLGKILNINKQLASELDYMPRELLDCNVNRLMPLIIAKKP